MDYPLFGLKVLFPLELVLSNLSLIFLQGILYYCLLQASAGIATISQELQKFPYNILL